MDHITGPSGSFCSTVPPFGISICSMSRTKAFKDDDVLQENIIIRLERGGAARQRDHFQFDR